MPKKKYLVTLSNTERDTLEHLLRSGQHATRKVTRARILLKAAEGWGDEAIARALDIGRRRSNAPATALLKRGWGRWKNARAPSWVVHAKT